MLLCYMLLLNLCHKTFINTGLWTLWRSSIKIQFSQVTMSIPMTFTSLILVILMINLGFLTLDERGAHPFTDGFVPFLSYL